MFQTRSVLRWSWQRHTPKSRLLSFKGILKTRTWDEKSREIPCPSKLKEPDTSNYNSSKHATLNCNYLLWLPVKNCFQNGCDIGWGPRPVVVLDVHRGLRCQQQLAALHAAVECCRMQRSPTSAPQASEAPPAAAPGGFWAPGPLLVHGRPRLRPSPGESRRSPAWSPYCCPVQRGPAAGDPTWPRRVGPGSAGRGAGGPAPPPGRHSCAATAMSSSPARGEMQQKWSSSVP